ncbi:PD40 domain-containing protein [Pelagicoccus mobilis]|uniref:PD40 domain-containing protein n=1 Tax=Pelagicoccus mobilis TaxID=415221 RepID=A0A934VSX1_9BACT|nr:PD40 domain-containing protein [Pelagicoccus mobilis]MBK1879455.1 PD40 domain-containing protein [Pelagicoccus mobilis]
MHRIYLSITFIISALALITCGKAQQPTRAPAGPYLGQKPPGLVPEVFAPGIVSTKHLEVFGIFSPDMQEFYFVRRGGAFKDSTLLAFRNGENGWTESVVSPSVGEPFISPDGKTMYFGNKYMERTDAGWSEVKQLEAPFRDIPIMRLTASTKGTYVLDAREEVGTLRYSRLKDGKREQPKAFGKEVNSGKWTAHPFIAPDESYLIWDSVREGGYGDSDLYISFRQKDGSWGPAINMGPDINTERENIYGSVTPDGKYFFYHTYFDNGEANIYWVDAKVIEKLRPEG